MRKIVSLVLALLMVSVSFAAFAEGSLYFDENSVAALEGEFVALEDFGLQLWLPSALLGVEVTDEQAEAGTYAIFSTEDGTSSMSIGYAAVADADGNMITTLEDLAAFYTANGIPCEIAAVNDLPMAGYTAESIDTIGVMMMSEDGTVLTFNFTPVSDENYAAIVAVIISSIMAAE